ncbi:hypothetical protein CH380_10260 [Leptospira adleri]|uniref:Uncharacterized protein n=1 Tax=Leptospira adleri TaxID=2023186 RepID=A0A2M9YNS3_9LEPT|nr:hypothetical protein CH380_10260 [Leptospira adleri]PJZ64003.1 hypothetical protein CH376_00850 [Leptospira adleri]
MLCRTVDTDSRIRFRAVSHFFRKLKKRSRIRFDAAILKSFSAYVGWIPFILFVDIFSNEFENHVSLHFIF